MRWTLLLLAFLVLPGGAQETRVNLRMGWNGVAFAAPRVLALDNGPEVAGLAWYEGGAYRTGSLTADEVNRAGGQRGFWVYANLATSFSYTADVQSLNPHLQLRTGWNLVSFAQTEPIVGTTLSTHVGDRVLPIGSTVLPLFYQVSAAGTYLTVDITSGTLVPSRATWIYSLADCTLSWTAAPSPSPSPGPAAGRFRMDEPSDGVSCGTNRHIARAANGDFIAAWLSRAPGTTVYQMVARRYTAAGSPVGPPFVVASDPVGSILEPTVAMDPSGNFVVSWTAFTGGRYQLFARVYRADGTPRGAAFRVNTSTTVSQAAVATDASGNFIVVWSGGGGIPRILAQRYTPDGTPQGGEFQVNQAATGAKLNPSVGMSPDGHFVVAWGSDLLDPSRQATVARRYAPDGTPQGNEFQVNIFTSGDQWQPSVGMDGSNNFVVTWMSAGQDGSGAGIYARRYNAAGSPLTVEFRVNATTQLDQSTPEIGMNPAGQFVIVWNNQLANSEVDVRGQRYAADGTPQGGEIQVANEAGDQQDVDVALDAAGNFVTFWRDSTVNAIFGRRYAANGTALP